MASIELVIKIPKNVYNDMIKLVKVDGDIDRLVDVAIVNGTPLEKHDAELLDKIRAEIENHSQLRDYPVSSFSCGLRNAIKIIDKYKKESEVSE